MGPTPLMVVDASALLAILLAEAEADAMADALFHSPQKFLSPVNLVEASIVITRQLGPAGIAQLDALLEAGAIELAPVDREQALLARTAYARFGKGRHPAALNLGDCFAYALAQSRGTTLLFKGGDFGQTDGLPAL